jgi:hypothetical protein
LAAPTREYNPASRSTNAAIRHRTHGPGAWSLSPDQLKALAQKSNSVLAELGPTIKWEQSYVTGDKLYCVYTAPDADIIREHARRGGFAADSVSEVKRIISPATGQ